MARKFLTNLDLVGNQLLNATFEKLATDPATGNFEGRIYYNTTDDILKVYDGTSWIGVGAIRDVQGTANEIEVSVSNEVATISLPTTINANTTGNAATASALATARTISLNGDVSGSASFDGTSNITITTTVDSLASVDSITGTENEVEVSASVGAVTIGLPSTINANTTGNAATASALQTPRTIALGGDLSGSASFDGSASITITADIQANSVALGTDTTGDYVTSVSASDGISATGSGEGATVSLTNTDKGSSQNIFKTISGDSGSVTAASNSASVTIAGGTGITTSVSGSTITIDNDGILSVTGTANEVEVSASNGSVTVGLPNDVIIGNNLTVTNALVVSGDLTVSGTTTTVNTETINLADNIINLNSNLAASASPTEDAGISVNRGSANAVSFIWNETLDVWQATTDGTTYKKVLLSGDAASTDISDFTEATQDAVGTILTNTATVNLVYTDNSGSAGTVAADVVLKASNSYLSTASGLAIDISSLESKLITDSFTKKASANVGNGSNTSFAVGHNLNTKDVIVNIYDNSTDETVEADVVRTNANTVTVSFSSAPSSNAYRVVVIG